MSDKFDHPSSRNKKDRRKVNCWFCRKRDHVQSKCRQRIRQDHDYSFKEKLHSREGPGGFSHHLNNNNLSDRQSLRESYNHGQHQKRNQCQQYNQRQARGFLTSLHTLSASTTGAKFQQTCIDCRSNDHFVWDRKVFVTYDTVCRASVNTCAGMGTIFGQDLVRFQMSSTTLSLMCKHVPEFDKNFIALSKLVHNYKVVFEHSKQFC